MTQSDYQLLRDERGLYLKHKDFSPLRIEFGLGKIGYRSSLLSNELIAKAVGMKGGYRPVVVDATAGLGQDAYILSRLGCQVTAIEKNAIIAALLRSALEKSDYPFHLVQADSIDYLQALTKSPDVIYLDPMFPVRKKAAKVKKEMQILSDLLKEDHADSDLLLEIALKKALKRVVVKRPKNAPCLSDKKPDVVYRGKAIRFDVYMIHSVVD